MLNKLRVSFDSSVLKNLVNSKESCVIVRPSCKRNLELLPLHLSDLKASVKEILESRVTSYDIELGGLILGYKNVKVVDGLELEDNGNINLDILADIYVFKPSIGCTLKGVVNKKGKDHVGCLVHGVFNAVVPRPHDQPSWLGSTAALGQHLLLTVDKVDLTTSTLPYIRGQIVSLSCTEEDMEGIDSGIGCGESVEGEESPRKKRKRNKNEETEEMNRSEVEVSLAPVSMNSHGHEESPSKKSKKKKKWKEEEEEKQTDLGVASPRLDVNEGESASLKKSKRKYRKDEILEQESEITRNGKESSSTSESEIVKSSLKGILKHHKNMECLRTQNKSDGDDSPRGSGKGGDISKVKRRSKGPENSMSIVPYLFKKQTPSVSPPKTRKGEDSPWGNDDDKGENDGPTAMQDAKSIISDMLEEKNSELSPAWMNRDVDVEETPQRERKRKKEKRKSNEMEETRRSELSHLIEEKIAELSPARMSKAMDIEESPQTESKEERKKEKRKSREMEESRRSELSHLIEEKIAELSPARMSKAMDIEESPQTESKEERKKEKRKSREMEESRRSELSHLIEEKIAKLSPARMSKAMDIEESPQTESKEERKKKKEKRKSREMEESRRSELSHLIEEKIAELSPARMSKAMDIEESPQTESKEERKKKKEKRKSREMEESRRSELSHLIEEKIAELSPARMSKAMAIEESPQTESKEERKKKKEKRKSREMEESRRSELSHLIEEKIAELSPARMSKAMDIEESPQTESKEERKKKKEKRKSREMEESRRSELSHLIEEKIAKLSPARMSKAMDIEESPQTESKEERKKKKEKRKSREMEESRRSELSHLIEEKIAKLSPARMSKAMDIEESPQTESKEERKKKKEKRKSREMEESRRSELSHLIEERIAKLSPARMSKAMAIEESPSECKEERKKKKEKRKSREMEETRRTESSHLLDGKTSQVRISKGDNHTETHKSRNDEELNSSKNVEFNYTNSAISHLLEEKSSELGLESPHVTVQETQETKKKKGKSNGGNKDSLISSLLESKLTEIETQIMTPEGSQQKVKTREDSVGDKEGRLDKEKTKDLSEVGRKKKRSKYSDESSTDGMIENILNSTRLSLETFLSPKDIPKTSKNPKKRASDVFSPEQILSTSNTVCNSSPQNIKRKSKGRDETFVLNSLGIEENKKRKRLDSTDENLQSKKKRKSRGLDASIEDLTKAMLASVANLN